MKTNLKNFPKLWYSNYHYVQWRKDFEAELREILRTNRQIGYDLFPSEGEKKLAKEILGE